MLRDALLVAEKDLRIEARSKVTLSQVAPFGILVLLIFAFGLDNLVIPDRGDSAAPQGAIAASAISAGLFWLAVLFAATLAIQRSFAIESADGGRDGLRLSMLDPAGIFLGKAGAVFVQLLALEVVLGAGTVLFYGASLHSPVLLLVTSVLATVGLAAVGTLHGALSAGLRVRDTLLPLLYFPVVAPVVLAAVRATQAALTSNVGEGWPWVRLLLVFATAYVALGVLLFGALLEES